jgi:hypothetical protein
MIDIEVEVTMPKLQGTLEDLRAMQLFQLINHAKRTGTLHIYEVVPTAGRAPIIGKSRQPEPAPGKDRVRMAFKEGKLIHAFARDQDGHLASVLYKSGKLTEAQYQTIREKAANYTDRALALLLINANYVTREAVLESVQRQAIDIACDVMTWTKEPFAFEDGEQPAPDLITAPIDVGEVIREGTRRNQDVDDLLALLPNLDFRLKFPSTAPTDKLRQSKTTREEWQVLGNVTGRNTIRQIAKTLNMTDTEIRRVVAGLLNSGQVELDKPASAPLGQRTSTGRLPR